MKRLFSIFKQSIEINISIALALCLLMVVWNPVTQKGEPALKAKSSYSPKAAPTTALERDAYFFNVLRDPLINRIPENIRVKEIGRYEQLLQSQLKSVTTAEHNWVEMGPNDVGGRTRALAVDVRNSNVILAGGISGGIWKSTDKGVTWTLKNTPDETFSVSSICQDPRPGHQDTWYYSSGEYTSNSASATGASYYGHGIYVSEDNGETWTPIEGTSSNPYKWDDLIDFVSRIKVDPTNGDLYLAAHAYGLMMIRKEAETYNLDGIKGKVNDHSYCDFDIDASGNILLVLSEYGYNSYFEDPPIDHENAPGVYYASAGTFAFNQIDETSSTFPVTHQRSMIRFAPSNPDVGYVFTCIEEKSVSFHKIDVPGNSLLDRTANLPNFEGTHGQLGVQGNYNMTLEVKPDDENFVMVGSTSLFRSNDGFATAPTADYSWIGGYYPDGTSDQYTNHHADCHITVFDPNNTAEVWSGHDGGLSWVADITQATTTSSLMPWMDKNAGYNVTQYYTLADPVKANDTRLTGGTQDNGTPYFRNSGTPGASEDLSSGDGSYCYIGKNYMYVSSQNGQIMRVGYDSQGEPLNPYAPSGPYNWSTVYPSDATGQLFINPFVLDPNDENTMYYAAGTDLWINHAIEDIPIYNNDGSMLGWSAPAVLSVADYTISAMAVSRVPSHILYYAAYNENNTPKLFKLMNSTGLEKDLAPEDISISAAPSGSYPYYIAVNPVDAEEVMVVFSNYGVPSVFHSDDGGTTFTQVDGNLTATESVPGPSFRSAAILPWNGTTSYLVSTSIGVYSTDLLNGASTNWTIVANNQMGNVVCNRVKANPWDGSITVATHGRGLFRGTHDNPLFINNQLPNLQKYNDSPNENMDVSDVFGHASSQAVTVTVHNNSNTGVVTASLNAQTLTLDFSDTEMGTALITLRGTSQTDVADMIFSIKVGDGDDTSIGGTPEHIQVLQVYPNPNKGVFKFQLDDSFFGTSKVTIYSAEGQNVLSRHFYTPDELAQFTFDLSGLSDGLYMAHIETDRQIYTSKVVKR
jgi:hypothetical protein